MESHGPLEVSDALVTHLCVISWHKLRLSLCGSSSFSTLGGSGSFTTLFLLGLFATGDGTLGSLLYVKLRVPVGVEPIGTVLLEEELLEEGLELCLRDRGQQGDITFLSIENVGVGGKFLLPVTVENFNRVLVFL